MKRGAVLLMLAGCANQFWSLPRPTFTTVEADQAWARALVAVTEVCGGVSSTNEEAGVVVGAWEAFNTGDGLYLTQCLVSLQRGDEQVRDVRLTFASRKCPLSDMAHLAAIAPTCEYAELVPEVVKTAVEAQAKTLEAKIRVKPHAIPASAE